MTRLVVRNLVSVFALGTVALGPTACDTSRCLEWKPVYDPRDPYAERCVRTAKEQREELDHIHRAATQRARQNELRRSFEKVVDAAASGNLAEVKQLIGEDWYQDAYYLRHSTDPPSSFWDWDRRTPLHAAALNGRGEVVDYLVNIHKLLRSLNARDSIGNTPLHLAAIAGHAEIIDRLLDAGASVDVADEQGATPLHEAAERGHLAAVARLMDSGADAGSRTDEGKTPLALAREAGHAEVVEWFNSRGVH